MKKKIITFLLSFFVLNSNTYANNYPYVNISKIGECFEVCQDMFINNTATWSQLPTNLMFRRKLLENKFDIENDNFYSIFNFTRKTKRIKKKYKFFILFLSDIAKDFDREKYNNYKKNYVKYKGIYILDENNMCIGYCLIEKAYFGHQKNAIEISQIKNLNKNNNFLKNKIINPRLNFYEKDHGNYIERYAISDDFFEMQAFYPKELEKNLENRIKKVLNYNYIHGVDYQKINNNILKGLEEYEINQDSEDDENELDEN